MVLKQFLFKLAVYTAYNNINSGIKLAVHNHIATIPVNGFKQHTTIKTDDIYDHYIISFDFIQYPFDI